MTPPALYTVVIVVYRCAVLPLGSVTVPPFDSILISTDTGIIAPSVAYRF